MNRLVVRTRGLLRNLVNLESSLQPSIRGRPYFAFVTSVSGFDNKHTYYKTQIRPRWTYGDDACFVSITEASCVLGVADGVGGWRSYGVDPSNFSKKFMSACERLARSGRFQPDEPMLLVTEGYHEVLEAKTPLLGSATFCIISLCRSDGRLYTVCLGDSGYLIIRRGGILQRSAHQKHALNTPFQLACLPPNEHGHFHRDGPEQAIQSSVKLEPGDIVVVGTDGLFDNLTDSMILQEVQPLEGVKCTSESDDLLDLCATRLVNCARHAAENPNFVSPFANEARQYGLNIAGMLCSITLIIPFSSLCQSYRLYSSSYFSQSCHCCLHLLDRHACYCSYHPLIILSSLLGSFSVVPCCQQLALVVKQH
ncbi:unnamed protein product [Dibothriocephalus latus]|uniref:Protein phosphatase n=1 Tax=Dibothriocephalus latus TaxID=60516 RepID=A0A3P7L8C0_DIBLA|nr:unnamed protein product [Dibothriocephalus latus]